MSRKSVKDIFTVVRREAGDLARSTQRKHFQIKQQRTTEKRGYPTSVKDRRSPADVGGGCETSASSGVPGDRERDATHSSEAKSTLLVPVDSRSK